MKRLRSSLNALLFCALFSLAALPVQAQTCSGLEIASDQGGVRVRDVEGQWRYITQAEALTWVQRVTYRHEFAPWYVQEPNADEMRQLFGACAETFAPMAVALLGFPEPPRREGNAFAPGQAISLLPAPMRAPTAHLFTTAGTDLVDAGGALYAVADDGQAICGILPAPQAGALACTEELRGQITGVVREIADAFHAQGVSAIGWPPLYYFRDGRLRAEFAVTTPQGARTLRFEE